MKLYVVGIAGLMLVATAGQVQAGFVNIVGDTGDGQIGADGSIAGISDQTDRTGTGGNNNRGLALIYLFDLPTLQSGTTITNAELQFEYVSKEGTPEFNIDLFGIDARPDAIFDGSDYYDGNSALSSDVLIQTGLITPSASIGSISVSNLSLFNFVNSLYNIDGTPVSDFATFRVNPDVDLPPGSPPIRGYFLALADNSTASFRPSLSLTTTGVPEPASVAMWSMMGGIGFMVRRKRKKVA